MKLEEFKKLARKYKKITKAYIDKSNFKERWPLVNSNTILIHIIIDDFLDGVAVLIGNNVYALTENLQEIEFLPNKHWLNDKNSFITVNGNTKASLYDLIKYAESTLT